MQISSRGIDLLVEFEGFRSRAYQDVAGVWTIGYGSTRINGRPVRPSDVCTKEQARFYMLESLRDYERAVERAFPQRPTQSQFDALVVFVYNVGIGGFQSSTIYRKIKSGSVQTITESNFVAWNKARINGQLVEVPGLTRRRRAEFALFSTGA